MYVSDSHDGRPAVPFVECLTVPPPPPTCSWEVWGVWLIGRYVYRLETGGMGHMHRIVWYRIPVFAVLARQANRT